MPVRGKPGELGPHTLLVVGMEPGYPEPGVQGECLGGEPVMRNEFWMTQG